MIGKLLGHNKVQTTGSTALFDSQRLPLWGSANETKNWRVGSQEQTGRRTG